MNRRLPITLVALLLALSTSASWAQLGKSQGALDPNIASESELVALPGMNAATVAALKAKRPFLTMTDFDALLAAQGLAPEQRTALYPKLFLHINLNSASREEILLVPGLGKRMAHEFEEYRPYDGLARFRKEIGKYVDAVEVARLEQYVFVPLDLNTATDEEILAIPGMGKRMLHEFKEYRPYTSMAQFRKEIGKYVDQGEVERLARYVAVR